MKIISFFLCCRGSWLPLIEMEVYWIAQSVKSLSKCLIWIIYSKIWGWWVQSPWVPRVLNLWSYFVVGQCLMRVEFEDNCSLKMYLSNTNVPSKMIWIGDYLSLEMNHKEYLNLKKAWAQYFFKINSWHWIKQLSCLNAFIHQRQVECGERAKKEMRDLTSLGKILLRSDNDNGKKKKSISYQGSIPV